jgi:SAM-dependent methyltransferase
MADEPQTWHHGLIARWWAEFNTDGEDIACFRKIVLERGEPALDLGCGTGRLLVPCLEAGLDIDGCDISADMLSHCRARAEAAGFSPRLFNQPMHALDTDRAYRTIFICGSFGLGGDRGHDLATLRSAHRHLVPGGTLAFDIELANHEPRSWKSWLPSNRPTLPSAWPEEGARRTAADGSELELTTRVLAFDPLDQFVVREIRATHYQGGKIVAQQEHALRINLYFKSEVLLMLAHAGFRDVEVRGGLTDRAAVAYEDGRLVFVARK